MAFSFAGKCEHGVYKPTGDKTAIYCPLCNPDYLAVGRPPVEETKPKKARRKAKVTGDLSGNRTTPADACTVQDVHSDGVQ
jgi:hypothetical protein